MSTINQREFMIYEYEINWKADTNLMEWIWTTPKNGINSESKLCPQGNK